MRTLRATGEVEPVFIALLDALLPGGEADLVLDASIAVFLACILRDSRSASMLVRSSDSCQRMIDVLARLVCAERADELLSEANRAASKNEKRMLGSVGQVIDNAAVLSTGPATVRNAHDGEANLRRSRSAASLSSPSAACLEQATSSTTRSPPHSTHDRHRHPSRLASSMRSVSARSLDTAASMCGH